MSVTPLHPQPPDDLHAYLDGQLDAAESAVIETRLAGSARDRADLDEYRALVSLLGGLPQYEAPRSFTITPEMTRPTGQPAKILRLLPAVRALSIAAVVAFVVITAFAIYDRVDSPSRNDSTQGAPNSETGSGADASESTTGDTAPGDNGLVNRGESAASGAVPPESPGRAAPATGSGTAEASGTNGSDDAPVSVATTSTSDDQGDGWLFTSGGLGVLTIVLVGLWIALQRRVRQLPAGTLNTNTTQPTPIR